MHFFFTNIFSPFPDNVTNSAYYSSIKIQTNNLTYMQFQCLLCEYSSCHVANIKRHIRAHTGERPFKCHICNKGFTQQNNLKRHVSIHRF